MLTPDEYEILEELQRQTGRTTQRVMTALQFFIKARHRKTTEDNIHTDKKVLYITSVHHMNKAIKRYTHDLFVDKVARNITDNEASGLYHKYIRPNIIIAHTNYLLKGVNADLLVFDLCIPIKKEFYENTLSQAKDAPIVGRESVLIKE